MVAEIGAVPLLVALKSGSGPVPDTANPISGLLLVQE